MSNHLRHDRRLAVAERLLLGEPHREIVRATGVAGNTIDLLEEELARAARLRQEELFAGHCGALALMEVRGFIGHVSNPSHIYLLVDPSFSHAVKAWATAPNAPAGVAQFAGRDITPEPFVLPELERRFAPPRYGFPKTAARQTARAALAILHWNLCVTIQSSSGEHTPAVLACAATRALAPRELAAELLGEPAPSPPRQLLQRRVIDLPPGTWSACQRAAARAEMALDEWVGAALLGAAAFAWPALRATAAAAEPVPPAALPAAAAEPPVLADEPEPPPDAAAEAQDPDATPCLCCGEPSGDLAEWCDACQACEPDKGDFARRCPRAARERALLPAKAKRTKPAPPPTPPARPASIAPQVEAAWDVELLREAIERLERARPSKLVEEAHALPRSQLVAVCLHYGLSAQGARAAMANALVAHVSNRSRSPRAAAAGAP